MKSFFNKCKIILILNVIFFSLGSFNVMAMHHENDADLTNIKKLYKDWDIAVETSNIQGYIDSLDENVTLIPPGGSVVKGRMNYKKFLGPVFDYATYEIEEKSPREFEFFGDVAIVRYHLVVYITPLGNSDATPSEGALQDAVSDSIYFDILRKQEDGSWKCLVHTWKQIN